MGSPFSADCVVPELPRSLRSSSPLRAYSTEFSQKDEVPRPGFRFQRRQLRPPTASRPRRCCV